jgi:hypothetical protein
MLGATSARIKESRADMWASYAKSCTSATFVTLCVPNKSIQVATIERLQRLGIGLIAVDVRSSTLTPINHPIDLTMNLTLPPVKGLPTALRGPVNKIHARFKSGDWKKGFEEACKLTESTARKYLLRQVLQASPIRYIENRKTKTLTEKRVSKMTLGQLAVTFCTLLAPKMIDNQLCAGLKRINPDRVDVTHALLTSRKERRLRQNVGRHMWTIHNLLKSIPR